MIFSKGEPLKKVPTERLVDELFAEIDRYYESDKTVVRDAAAAEEARQWLAEKRGPLGDDAERLAAIEAEKNKASGGGRTCSPRSAVAGSTRPPRRRRVAASRAPDRAPRCWAGGRAPLGPVEPRACASAS